MMLILILAAFGIALQLFDLHTTSEVLKRSMGTEMNKRLAGFLNDTTKLWADRFWKLVAVKIACVVAILFAAGAAIAGEANQMVVLIALLVHDLYYAPIVWKNWKIYRGEGR